MPAANLYYSNPDDLDIIKEMVEPLKKLLAKELTCKERALDPRNEISIRILETLKDGMLADIEMDITAAPYPERVERQDQICLTVQKFIRDKVPSANNVHVWLSLHELGHSFEE